ncbi:MAG TPA: hypothetical protein VHV10_19235 [Ktedonobacteraceae bacterium]|nr:hypothetical protein [Ktedonobacteraceae bacterium]
MSNNLQKSARRRFQALHLYTRAMESGDIDTVSTVLHEAEHDQVLERMLLDINEVYQIEDLTTVQPDEVAAAHNLLLSVTPMCSRSEPQEIKEDQLETVSPSIRAQASEVLSMPIVKEPLLNREKRRIARSLPSRTLSPRKWYQRRRAWMGVVAAVLLVVLIVPGAGVLANQFLGLFRVQQFQLVMNVDPRKIQQDLSAYLQNFGTLQTVYNKNNYPATVDRGQAQSHVNFPIQLPDQLPSGVGHVARFSIMSGQQGTYVFSAAGARAYLAKTGQDTVSVPAQLDGVTFTVSFGSGVAISYNDNCDATSEKCDGGTPFQIREIPSPVIQGSGNASEDSLNELRTFILSLPKLSPELRELLQRVDPKSGIVPVPIPPQVNAQQVTINGATGLLASANQGQIVAWQANGVVYLIGTTVQDSTQLLAVARSFH